MNIQFASIAREFAIEGHLVESKSLPSGLIHDSFLLEFDQNETRGRYLLQKINRQVFKDPVLVMENMTRVTEHLRQTLSQRGCKELDRRTLRIFKTTGGLPIFEDNQGEFWRIYPFIEGCRDADPSGIPSEADIYQAAHGFGEFLSLLHNLPDPPLRETIPNFYSGPHRWQAFQQALQEDPLGRVKNLRREIATIEGHAPLFDLFPKALAKGLLQLRSVHGDTKVDNVLLDAANGRALCVIDLDTVGPGLAPLDFGDLLRSVASPTLEDQASDEPTQLEFPRFLAALKGFLDGAGPGGLDPGEIAHLVDGAKLMTLLLATRFLTDHLLGDHYFKITRPQQNIQRCRNQLDLLESMLDQEHAMKKEVAK